MNGLSTVGSMVPMDSTGIGFQAGQGATPNFIYVNLSSMNVGEKIVNEIQSAAGPITVTSTKTLISGSDSVLSGNVNGQNPYNITTSQSQAVNWPPQYGQGIGNPSFASANTANQGSFQSPYASQWNPPSGTYGSGVVPGTYSFPTGYGTPGSYGAIPPAPVNIRADVDPGTQARWQNIAPDVRQRASYYASRITEALNPATEPLSSRPYSSIVSDIAGTMAHWDLPGTRRDPDQLQTYLKDNYGIQWGEVDDHYVAWANERDTPRNRTQLEDYIINHSEQTPESIEAFAALARSGVPDASNRAVRAMSRYSSQPLRSSPSRFSRFTDGLRSTLGMNSSNSGTSSEPDLSSYLSEELGEAARNATSNQGPSVQWAPGV